MADAIVASEERGKWHWVRDEFEGTARISITNPYEISLSGLCDLDRGLVALLGDAIDYGLISLQAENKALRDRIAMLEAASGADVADLAAAANAAKAAREADAAGYKAVIAELRAEMARLKGRGSESGNPDVVFGISSLNITQDPRAAEGIARARSRAKMKGGEK